MNYRQDSGSTMRKYRKRRTIVRGAKTINTKNGRSVIISEEVYRGMLETLHLTSIPNMVKSIKEAEAEPPDKCTVYKRGEKW